MRKERYNALHAGLLTVLLGLIVMLPGMIKFGGMFMIRGDYINQTITRMITAKNMLFGGSLPLWNWKNFLGTAYTGAFSVLLSFNAVSVLFPTQLMPFAAMLVQCIRWFVMGVSSYAFIRRFVKKHKSAVAGALLYAFSGYAMASLEFIAFYSSMAVFPLLLLAVEKRFTDDNYKFLLIPVTAINVLASSYLFIGSSLALLVYALIRFFTADEWKKNRKFGFILLCLAEYFIGAMICGFTISNFIKSMLTTSRSTTTLAETEIVSGAMSSLIIPRHLFDVIASLFLPAASNRVTTFFTNTNWFSMQACLPLFGFALCFSSLLRRGLKDGLNLALCAMLVISILPLLNNLSSFYANGYTRWWYALTFIMSLVTVRELDRLDEAESLKPYKAGLAVQWCIIAAIPIIYLAAYFLRGTGITPIRRFIAVFLLHDYKFGLAEDVFRIYSVAVAVIFAALLTAIIASKNMRRYALTVLCCCIALYGASFVALNNNDLPLFDELFNSPKTDKEVKPMTTVVNEYYGDKKLVNIEDYTFRVDYPDVLYNYAAVIDQPGICFFESTIDTDAVRFAVFAGMGEPGAVLYKPNDRSNALRTLLSVKYYYNYMPDDDTVAVPEGFKYLYTAEDTAVYENENFIPFGFAYDSYILEDELFAVEDAGVGLMLHTLVIEGNDEAFVSRYLPHCDSLEADLAEDVAARSRCASSDFHGNSEGFVASCSNAGDEVIFFSVPYDEGWEIEVDGKPCEPIRANLGFFALVVPEGEHEVRCRYHSASILPGVICTCAGMICAIIYIAISATVKRRKFEAENNPSK